MKVKFANKVFEVLYTKKVAGLTMYAVEDEPNHIDWLINVEVIDAEKKELKKIVVPKFNVHDCVIKKHSSNINDFGYFTITDITGGKYWYNDRIICDISEQDEWELYEPVRQNHTWSEESINKPNGKIVMEDFNDGNGYYKVNIAYLNEEQVEEIEELVKRWDLQSKENEEDSIISDLLDYFDEDKCLKHEVNDIVKWLKTIKPQQKGWGENEIKMLDNLITYLDERKDLLEEIKRTYIDWLKSLKERL